MTQAVDVSLAPSRRQEFGLVASVSFAHLVSHYYMMVLPPLLVIIRADYGASYTEIGLALSVFNIVSSIFQTPVGFLVDRTGARLNLVAGLLLGAAALVVAALVDSYWMFIAMFAVLGLANTVFHPADYALLSNHVRSERMAQVFSVHTFSGMFGGAIAPPTLLFMTVYVGWRGAFVGAAIFGVVAALALLLLQRDPPKVRPKEPHTHASTAALSGWRLLMSPPILLNLVFFMLVSLQAGGLNHFLVVALGDLHGTPLVLANTALTIMLFTSAGGVLLGGLLLTRTSNHALVTYVCFAIITAMALLLAFGDFRDFGAVALIAVISFSGLATGVMSPSRDMIVRSVTPPGAFGAVFGFVTNGFTIAGIASPILFGLMMDHGMPRWVFVTVAIAAVLSAITVLIGRRWGHG